jgi:hypothetical protein
LTQWVKPHWKYAAYGGNKVLPFQNGGMFRNFHNYSYYLPVLLRAEEPMLLGGDFLRWKDDALI